MKTIQRRNVHVHQLVDKLSDNLQTTRGKITISVSKKLLTKGESIKKLSETAVFCLSRFFVQSSCQQLIIFFTSE